MAGIFINYRSDEAGFAANLIDERIRLVFGPTTCSWTAAICAGVDFKPELWRRLLSSSVLLVLIGPQWLTLTDGAGRPRLEDPDDFVHAEIRAGLQQGKYVMPVLLEKATLPSANALPPDIASLNQRQYVHLRVRQADIDLDHLVRESIGGNRTSQSKET